MKKNYFLLFLILLACTAQAQVINFPDANFKAKLLLSNVAFDVSGNSINVDANSNGQIEVSEVQAIDSLSVPNSNIADLTGISNFNNLKSLKCDHNQIQNLTIDHFILLKFLDASHNILNNVDAAYAPGNQSPLMYINLSYNNLESFTHNYPFMIADLDLSHNQMTHATLISGFRNLDVSYNNLTSIQIQGSFTRYANFTHNQLTFLDLSNVSSYSNASLHLGWNVDDTFRFDTFTFGGEIYLTTNNSFIDFQRYHGYYNCNTEHEGILHLLNCPNLEYFSVKNGLIIQQTQNNCGGVVENLSELHLDISNCPQLSFICVDDHWREIAAVESELVRLGLQNQINVNSYCSFAPGGTTYIVNGQTRFDADGNGCDANDLIIPRQKLRVTQGAQVQDFVSNSSGNYFLITGSGTQSIAPVIENPTYFAASPASVSVNFPSTASPMNQNFCLTRLGTHPDLEIAILPGAPPIPGLDAFYKIVYKNKGTHTQSGTISFAFNDAVLDYVMSTPVVSSQVINYLNWDFTDLLPFETREILVILNANSPMENPPLNAGDPLTFTASVSSSATDETPSDNTFVLNQTVLNSFDPNDKTCLEGNKITPGMVGKDVHYMIRFENTGTANAHNIVVKDMIDTTKFDLNSLVPVSGSHPFVTKISGGNKVEFIFEDINLPFDDAHNDGYVAFKIKTKPTLVVGDSFSNNAGIYFDYNFPIITNTATTTVALLANHDFEFTDYFKVYPVPAKDVLNIETTQAIEVTSINIYNTLGQLVLTVPSAQQTKTIDVSSLKTGNYFMKINSDKGSSCAKFVKL